jgi:hypothetical protein
VKVGFRAADAGPPFVSCALIASSLPDQRTNSQEACAGILSVFVCNFGSGGRHRRTMIATQSTIASRASIHPEEELSALPIWTVTLGVFSLLTFGLTAVPSIICGHLALGKTRGNPRRSFERRVTTAGLAVGYLGAAILGLWIAFLVGRLLL